ncbi:DUF4391 domain-containing protein [uncultured Bifidobacterium sp.]|uniref:DUF4391 domain-containing protein n=1 Tax=uncultured Bifidobacterium sp. TaxID=165187 RepID=UPI0025875535|nr:DUF4391 domain-containing protein [uncultured Bifidobacterium sp.]MEE0653984.1 DUF4391 domain-containing protein [Bifidobacterium criceti]
MTMAACGSVTAATLGLPTSSAFPTEKSVLPKAMFAPKTGAPLSAKTKQHLVHAVTSITLLALLRPSNTGLEASARMPEVLVLGIRLADGVYDTPDDVIELIASQRKSGIVFAVVRDMPHEGMTREECQFVVRRAIPGRAGHTPTFRVFHGPWEPSGETFLDVNGATMDELWASFCSQTILGSVDCNDLDARIAREEHIRELEATVAKLSADHARAKNPNQRNEIYAKLHKAKNELATLTQ